MINKIISGLFIASALPAEIKLTKEFLEKVNILCEDRSHLKTPIRIIGVKTYDRASLKGQGKIITYV